jgi:para-nitrobenzyl esterase
MDFEAATAAMHVDALLLGSTDDEAAAFLHALPVKAVGPDQLAGFVGAHFGDPTEALSFIDSEHPGATDHGKLVAAMSLHQFLLAATELAGRADQAGIPATLLRFSVRSRLEGAGSPHCFDLPFLFGNRPDWRDAPMLDGFAGDAFDAVSDRLRPLLLGFVADGVARTPDGGAVPRFNPKNPELYRVSETGDGTAAVEPELRPRR